MKRFILLFIAALSFACAGNALAADHWTSFIEEFTDTKSSVKSYKSIIASQKNDGSWADIDYKSPMRGSWVGGKHASRFATLVGAWHETGDEAAKTAALKALEYWGTTKPVCKNWWWNVVGVPRAMGPAFYLLKDEMNEQQLAWALEIMDKSPFGQTGQNKVWRARNVFFRALLVNDKAMMKAARDTIVSEICVVDPSKEGIQQDWSYHQHGPQLQFGNYGLSYASDMSWWVKGFRGTEFALSEEEEAVIVNYVKEGLRWVTWNGLFDHNACARQVFRNAQKTKAKTARGAANRLGLAPEPEEPGARYYDKSDFGVYRAKDWYASIRMQSSRICGMETTNNENMKCYFSSDGALLTRIEGDEYYNISPVWDWRHVPGTTTYNDGRELWGLTEMGIKIFKKEPYNKSDLVFGCAEGEYMIAAMDYVRDGMKARKAWFFTPTGVVCLGAGISREQNDPVVTTLDQNILKGDVTSGRGWIAHRGITYVVLDGHKIKTAPYEHSGNWRYMIPGEKDKTVTMNVFDAWIEHGNAPKGASYAYVVAPSCEGCILEGAARAKEVNKSVKILSNTADLQKVSVNGKMLVVDWAAGKATIL